MIDLFYAGGQMAMSLLTIVGVISMVMLIISTMQITKSDESYKKSLTWARELGLFAIILGIFFQLTGLYQAFQAIELAGNISPALLAGGLKVSSIPSLYGMLIFIVTWVGYFGIKWMSLKPSKAEKN